MLTPLKKTPLKNSSKKNSKKTLNKKNSSKKKTNKKILASGIHYVNKISGAVIIAMFILQHLSIPLYLYHSVGTNVFHVFVIDNHVSN